MRNTLALLVLACLAPLAGCELLTDPNDEGEHVGIFTLLSADDLTLAVEDRAAGVARDDLRCQLQQPGQGLGAGAGLALHLDVLVGGGHGARRRHQVTGALGVADVGESWHNRVRIILTVRFNDKRRHDVGNLYPYVAKPIVDGLVDARLVPDDDDAHVIGPDLRRDPEKGPHRITITIEDLP